MNRPPFNKRELRRLADACNRTEKLYRVFEIQPGRWPLAVRDAAAFARLRLKVEGMIQEKKR